MESRPLLLTGLLAAVVTAGLGLAVETWRGDEALARELAADAQLDRRRAARGWLPSADEALAEPTAQLGGLRVELLVARESFVLPLPHGDVRGRAPAQGAARVAAVVADELSHYPSQVLQRIGLWHVVLCDELTEDALAIPSLPNVDHSLILDVAARGAYLRRLIHHEVFHFIDLADDGALRRDPGWTALNDVGFAYGLGGRTMRRPTAAAVEGAPPGFITPYATSALEEDKAETFAFAVAAPQVLRARTSADPVLAAKYDALRARLVALDPTFLRLFEVDGRAASRRGLHSPPGLGR